jgi:uncharacterized protein YbjT (DUF2867 family)
MSTPFLLTGVTGGLGAKVLHDMLHRLKITPSDIIATSRSGDARRRFEDQGVQFRVADYNRPETLLLAFENVKNLLFMSSSEFNNEKRTTEHRNVVEAAKAKGVEMVLYVSLAHGGFGDHSKVGFQQVHNATEAMLRE